MTLRLRRDLNNEHVIVGYEHLRFSSESDARSAIDLARCYLGDEMRQESRYRAAAERAKETT